MRNLLIFLVLTFTVLTAKAQSNYEDVVYLKNGSIIHGIILEQIPNKSIKIKSGSNTFVYEIAEVEKITKEEIQNSNSADSQVRNYEYEFKEYLINAIKNESKENLKLIDFKKTDGLATNIFGQELYEIWFTLTVQPTKKICKYRGAQSLSTLAHGGLWTNFIASINTEYCDYDAIYNPNQKIKLSGKAKLYKTEMNLKVSELSFYKMEVINDIAEIFKEEETLIKPDKESFYVNYDIPYYGKSYSKLSPINDLINNDISKLVKNKISTVLSKDKRSLPISQSEFEKITGFEKWETEITILKASSQLKTGKTPVTNQSYAGYECEVEVQIRLSHMGGAYKTIVEKVIVKGGQPSSNTNEVDAITSMLKELEKSLIKTNAKYQTFQSNIIEIIEYQKNSLPKTVTLDKAHYYNSEVDLYFIVTTTDGIYVGADGSLNISNKIATLVAKKTDSGKIVCKVLSGEANLGKQLSNGVKLIGISLPFRPADAK